MPALAAHRSSRSSPRMPPARSGAGSPGILKATVGAHEVITTIMLNWIAIWIGQVGCSGWAARSGRREQSIPRSNDVVERAKLPASGASRLQGLHIGHLHRARGARRLLASSSTARRSATRCARSASTPRRRATRHLRAPELLPRDGDLRRLRRARRRARHARLAVPARRARRPTSTRRLHRHRGRAARPQHGGRASSSPRCSSARSLGTSHAAARPGGLPARAGRRTWR